MKILIVGSGGREHALAWKLKQSPSAERIFCAPGNAGTAEIGENVAISTNDLGSIVRLAKENRVDLTVVGPDDPLAAGIVDLFAEEGLRIFGPSKTAARLESSKIFAKKLMHEQGIPTAQAGTFERSDDALRFCDQLQFPIVIKADGLALGKGVIIASDPAAARSTIDEMMNQGRFGEAGRRVVVEEFLRGTECSLHALVDGVNYRLLQTARDHKRVLDGDAGPNTGGMGAFSPANNWTAELEDQFHRKIMRPLLNGLYEKNITFRGLLYPGLMLSADGARVLEFNCRFGDPETQAILPRMKSDLLPLLEATIDGKIDTCTIEWDSRPAVTVVLASGGYPGKYQTGRVISGLGEAAKVDAVQVFHAGTKRVNDEIVTAGGRVLAVTALGSTIEAARSLAYEAVSRIDFGNCHYRRDIALNAVRDNVGKITVISRFLLPTLAISIFGANLLAQSPTPASPAPTQPVRPPPIASSPPAAPLPSPARKPTTRQLVNSLGPADLQAVITLLKSNFTNPDAITDTELSRATVEGLMIRLPRGVMLLPSKESAPLEAPSAFYGEVLDGHIGYLRLGSLNGANLQAMDKSLGNFAAKKVDALIVDLRSSQGANDFAVAAEFAKRFCPKGKPLFTLRKPAARQDRVFSSDRDPAFQGLVMVVADGDTSGAAEALASALRFYDKALVIGQPTAGRAVEYSDLPLPGGKILRVAVAEAVSPEGRSLFTDGIKPDLPVEMPPADKRQIFQSSVERGMGPFVYETGRPHMNEAALLAGTNPEVEAWGAAQSGRGRGSEKPPAHDPVLQRALDVVTSLEVYQKR